MKEIVWTDALNMKKTTEDLYDEKYFAYIFETYYKRVYNFIYYRINCHYTAEDLTSQVFKKVMLKLDTYSEDKSPFEVWLFFIARNIANDYFRITS